MNSFLQRRATLIRWTSVGLIFISLMAILQVFPMERLQGTISNWIESLGVWGPLVYAVIYAFATVALLPGWVLSLLAGALFGIGFGFLTVSFGSITGAAIAFLIARYAARHKVEKLVKTYPKFDAVDRAIRDGGWKIVAMLRMSPAVPFNLQNYLYGLTPIKFWHYFFASWIAMAPGTLMYVYLGHVAGTAALGSQMTIGQWVLLIIGFILTVVVTVYITMLARKRLKEVSSIEQESDKPEKEAAGDGDAEPAAEAPSLAKLYLTMAVAVAFVAGAGFVQLNSEKVSRFIQMNVLGMPPAVELEEHYADQPSDPESIAENDALHAEFAPVLEEFVDEDGWIDYAALKENPQQLNAYIAKLGELDFDSLGRDEKLATLINAYNAFTMKLIIEQYPVDSIIDIPAAERWDAVRWQVGRHTWSLNQIEHEEIRPKFAEPRIHFVLVCAAVGCPPLTREPYLASKLEEQLQAASEYVHQHETWVQVDAEAGVVSLGPLPFRLF